MTTDDEWLDIADYKDCVSIDVSVTTPRSPPLPVPRRRNRRELAVAIRDAVLAIPQWRTEIVGGHEILRTDVGELAIMRTTAASAFRGAPAENAIDIWLGRKVFSMWWHDGDVEPDEFEIIAMATGAWFAPLMEGR